MDEGMQAPLQLQAEEGPVGQPENQLHDHQAACQKEQQGDELPDSAPSESRSPSVGLLCLVRGDGYQVGQCNLHV